MSVATENKNKKTMIVVVGVVFGMIGLSYASVPLYDWFCRVTGYGGTTQVAADENLEVLDREMKVRFDASTARGLEWKFEPLQREVTLKVGENGLAFYRATNMSDQPIVGTATFNVTPQKSGPYFTKFECFCFTEQRLEPGESIDMPVAYYVDPEIDEDPNQDEVKTITLSYTFFRAETDEDDVQDELASLGTANAKRN